MTNNNEKATKVVGTPKTLEELGVPGPLAAEMEATFRLLGAVAGNRIVGFNFRTPDGARHALRTGTRPEVAHVPVLDRAA